MVKKMLLIGCMLLMLTGCGAQETFETLGNAYEVPASAQPWEMALDLPAEVAAPVMEGEDTGTLYLCDGYTLILQTMEAGDLNRTLRDCTGFTSESLEVIETSSGGVKRYETVWTAAGEGGEQVGRIAVLDDGSFHYVLTVMADAAQAGQLTEIWQPLFRSFRIVEPGSIVNTGS